MPQKVQAEVMAALALGTAQFGLRYGIANQSGQVPQADVAMILARAAAAGVDLLDTAIAYGESEAALGQAGVRNWRVITKLPPLPAAVGDIGDWVRAHVAGSLQRLGVNQLEGLLLHRSSDLLGPHGRALARALNEAKAQRKARAIGVSIYDPGELDALWDVLRPDIIQSPGNVLDRRLSRSGWLARLAQQGIRVHVRSVFLQGLLLMPAERRPKWFASRQGVLDRWAGWCRENGVTPLQGALAFAAAQNGVECLVVGVDSLRHLEEILIALTARAPLPPADLFSDDRELIDPTRWQAA